MQEKARRRRNEREQKIPGDAKKVDERCTGGKTER
jgi:hypothetical protein